MPTTRHDFVFTARYRRIGACFGVSARNTHVDLGPDGLHVRFGILSLQTDLDNIVDAEVTGGFTLLKTAGPPHLSFADRGITFATNPDRAVCLRFATPVPGIDPTGLTRSVLKHPGATLTVRDPDRFLVDLDRLRQTA